MKLLGELRRRNVLRAAIAYVITAWVVVESSSLLLEIFEAPAWAAQTVVIMLIAGFPVAMVFAWMFEITPDGLKPDREVDPATAAGTGRYIVLLSVVMTMVAAGLFVTDRFLIDRSTRPARADGPPVIAVLPFEIIGTGGGIDLSDGLHHDLLTRMSKLRAFSVISRTSMLEYRDTTKNMRQIGSELGATHILEGGVQVSGDKVRVNAQLIDADIDEHFWAETYDRDLSAEDLFAIQSELAANMAEQLEIAFSVDDDRYLHEVPTRNTEAYTAYLTGLRIRSDPALPRYESGLLAHKQFLESVRLDPEFVPGWVALLWASAYWQVVWSDYRSMLADTTKYRDRVRQLAPGSYDAGLAEIVYLYYVQNSFDQVLPAIEALEQRGALTAKALEMRGKALRRAGRFDDAYSVFLQAARLDPRSSVHESNLLLTARFLGDCGRAGLHAAGLLALTPDDANARAEAADYELNCNLNTTRARELVDGYEAEDLDSLWVARNAAAVDRNWDRLMELFELELPFQSWWGDPLYGQLVKAFILQERIGRSDEARAVLDAVGYLLDSNEPDDTEEQQISVIMLRLFYSALRRDEAETRRWAGQLAPIVERAGDWDPVSRDAWLQGLLFLYASSDLNDEAIQVMGEYFAAPHTLTFRHLEEHPAFDNIRDQPGYAALQQKYGSH
jgi:TolB-like protein